jgi:hypothetical protein
MPGPHADGGFPAIALLIPLVLVAVVAFAVWAYRQNQKKLEAMAAAAAANGWTFAKEDNRWVDAWAVAPFQTGRGRCVANCVSGTYRGAPFLAFEYHYYTESTSTDAQGHTRTTRHNHRFDVAVLRLGAPVPDLSLSPEGAFARLVDAVTGKDIDLESDAFNRAFRLHCADRTFAFDTFHARTMEYLLARGRISFDFTGGDVVLSRRGQGSFDPAIWGPGDQRVPLAQGVAPLDVVLNVLLGIPDFVWDDRGGRPATLPAAA